MKPSLLPYIIGALLMIPFGRVSAHTLKIDKNIGINLHIDPDDAPVAREESKLFVGIGDKSGRFNSANPENCDCRATILYNGVPQKTFPVTTGGTYNQLRYAFPSEGVYRVRISGKPNGKGQSFQQFQADFEYYVKPGRNESPAALRQNPLRMWVPYVAALAGSAVVLLFVL